MSESFVTLTVTIPEEVAQELESLIDERQEGIEAAAREEDLTRAEQLADVARELLVGEAQLMERRRKRRETADKYKGFKEPAE